MRLGLWVAAIFAALPFLGEGAAAQDVTLTARDGSLSISGTLQGFDGEFYRVSSRYGPLTVDGEGVICEGPGCPDLTATLAVLRITGAAEPGTALLPRLIAAYATTRGLMLTTAADGAGFRSELIDPGSGQLLAQISFAPSTPEDGRAALLAGSADLVVSLTADKGFGVQAMALDALVPIMAGDNALSEISTPDLAAALTGEIGNWKQLGGPCCMRCAPIPRCKRRWRGGWGRMWRRRKIMPPPPIWPQPWRATPGRSRSPAWPRPIRPGCCA